MNDRSFFDMIDLFSENHSLLHEGKWGIEKEAIRTTVKGEIALSPHPTAFGNKLGNPHITTDFSESQIEMVTSPENSIEKAYNSLQEIQSKVENNIGNEILWTNSMPPIMPDDEKIPVAKFDSSKQGEENEIYRKGLALRYGKKMQLISGIHYNFSFNNKFWDYLYSKSSCKDKRSFIDDAYFKIARNYLRFRWLLIYLFGASPVVDKSFTCDKSNYKMINRYKKYSVSLRMSSYGYSIGRQKNLNVSFNTLSEYINDIEKYLSQNCNEYKNLGIYKNGKKIQLNANMLQKESEFYSPIRFKSNTHKGESHLEKLKTNGVRYLEIRSIDLNPFYRLSISKSQLNFMHVFLIYCLFMNSDYIFKDEMDYIRINDELVALYGRKKNLKLLKLNEKKIKLEDWGNKIFEKLFLIAELLDKKNNGTDFIKTIIHEKSKIKNKYHLPSEKIIREMKNKKMSFIDFSLSKAIKYKKNNLDKSNLLCCISFNNEPWEYCLCDICC